jgi:hypothetical protein
MHTFNDNLESELKTTLYALPNDDLVFLKTEIQDGGEYILIQLYVDTFLTEERLNKLMKSAVTVVSKYINPRMGDYAWMIIIKKGETLLDCEVGGLSGV